MAAPSNLMELQYSAESSFCENAESPSSNTWTNRIPCKSYTLTTNQERIRDGGIVSRMGDENISHIGPREATLEFTANWIGHQGVTTGALTQTYLQDLLSDGLGGGSVATVGTTLSAATTASSMTFTSTTGLAVGAIVRVGAKGDAKGDGQPGVIGTVGTPVTLLTALPATPANTDVVYAAQVAYHDESVAQTLGTKRFLVGFLSSPTTGAQYHLMGGQLAGIRITTPVGQNAIPEITLTYRFAYWARSAVTIPSTALSLESHYASPIMGGSVFIQNFGTATRATITPSTMDLTIDLGLEPIVGPTGNGTYQQISGWARTMIKPTLSMLVPYTTAWETLFDTSNSSYTYQHILFGSNTIDGRSVGFYMPRCFQVGNRPSAPTSSNNQLYVPITFVGRESTTTTNELTRSAIRLYMA